MAHSIYLSNMYECRKAYFYYNALLLKGNPVFNGAVGLADGTVLPLHFSYWRT